MILEPFYPKEWVDSTYEIDWEGWREKGKKGVIFDIDNTLVPHGAPADERALALFKQLHGLGFQTILLSNNKEPRVKSFAEQVQSPYIYKAGKPWVKNYNRASGADGAHERGGPLCGGSALYRCVWSQPGRNLRHSCKTHQSERRDPDCVKTISGDRSASLL